VLRVQLVDHEERTRAAITRWLRYDAHSDAPTIGSQPARSSSESTPPPQVTPAAR
jgi:hypothetical protein